MSYAQATINDANAANVFAGVLDGLFISSGWTLVETLTPTGAALQRNKIYKSSGASNLCGYDWYVMMSYTTTGTENYVELWAGTGYDAGTKILSNVVGAPEAAATNAVGSKTATVFNASTKTVSPSLQSLQVYQPTSSSNVSPLIFGTLIPSSAFGYWASITQDHIFAFTTVATNTRQGFYSTLIRDPSFTAQSAVYNVTPILCWSTAGFSASGDIIGANFATGNYRQTSHSYSGNKGSMLPSLTGQYGGATAVKPDVYISGITGGGTAAGVAWAETAANGLIRMGGVPDAYFVSGGSIGDTITIAGATYVLSGPIAGSAAGTPTVAVLVE